MSQICAVELANGLGRSAKTVPEQRSFKQNEGRNKYNKKTHIYEVVNPLCSCTNTIANSETRQAVSAA